MAEPAPFWTVLALPAGLALAVCAVVAYDALLTASAAYGPARGPRHALHRATRPLREAARLMAQGQRPTRAADLALVRTGTALLPSAALLAAAVLPWGMRAVADPDVGIVWFNAMEALAWAAVWLTGWGPNTAFSMIGGYRFLALGLAYELPHMFALTTAALGAGSLRVSEVVAAQQGLWFVVWMPAAFAVYLLSALAMAFWGPFDRPAGSDVAGGAASELRGVDRLLFLGGRWLLLVVAAAFGVPLFLGGGHGPVLPPWAWTVVKTGGVLVLLVALRRALPALRLDRFMTLSWLVLLPLVLLQALVVSVVVVLR